MAEPLTQLRTGSHILDPTLNFQRGLLYSSWPQSLDEQSSSVGRAGGIIYTLYVNHRNPSCSEDNPKESSSGAGNDEGGSLAGRLSAHAESSDWRAHVRIMPSQDLATLVIIAHNRRLRDRS